MKRHFYFLTLILFGTLDVFSQRATKYSNEFLNLGVGARAMGMSNTAVAVTHDAYAGYWNPAGLTHIEENLQVAFMHSAYFNALANYDYLSITTKPNERSALGFTVLRFGVDGILNTFDLIRNGEINYDRISQFSAVDYAFMAHYAQEISTKSLRKFAFFEDAKISWGTNAKVINRKAGPFATAWGFGLDFGVQMTDLKGGWSFAAMGRDITTTFNSWRYNFTEAQQDVLAITGNEIPVNTLEITLPRLLLGAAKKFEFSSFDILAATDLEFTTDGRRNTLVKSGVVSIDPRVGIELDYKLPDPQNRVYIRMGVGNFQKEMKRDGSKSVTTFMPTIGVGLKIKQFVLDYALSDIGDQSAALYSNVISIRVGINGK